MKVEHDTVVDDALKHTDTLFRISLLKYSASLERVRLIVDQFPEQLDQDFSMYNIAQHSETNSDPDGNRPVEVLNEPSTEDPNIQHKHLHVILLELLCETRPLSDASKGNIEYVLKNRHGRI